MEKTANRYSICGRISDVIESSKKAEGERSKQVFPRKEYLNRALYGE